MERSRSSALLCSAVAGEAALMLRDHARFRLVLLRHGRRSPHWC